MKTLTERLEEIERLTGELKEYVGMYGFAPKDGELGKVEDIACDHICTSNCRREGCNCNHGEWHE